MKVSLKIPKQLLIIYTQLCQHIFVLMSLIMSLLIDLCAPELKAGTDHDNQNEDTQGEKNKPKLDEDHPEIRTTSVKPPEMCKYNKFLLCWFSVIQAMIALS